MRSRNSALLLMLVVTLLFAGCGQLGEKNPPSATTGSLSITAKLPANGGLGAQSVLDKIQLNLLEVWAENGNSTKYGSSSVVDNTATVVLDGMVPGTWSIEASLTDTLNLPVYWGNAQASVVAGQSTAVTMNMQLFNGSVDVDVTINGSSSSVARGEATLIKQDGSTIPITLSSNTSGGLSGTAVDITPGLWPLRVKLFDAANQVIATAESDVEVLPGRSVTANVVVDLGSGAISITFTYAMPPEPPTNVAASFGSGVVTLDWTPSVSSGATYRVYRSESESGLKKVLNETAISGSQFVDTDVELDVTYWYWLVTHAADGLTSGFSDPAVVETTTRIAFERNDHVWVMDGDGTNQVQLTASLPSGQTPAWRSLGTIVFHSGGVLYTISADGGMPTNHVLSGLEPAVSPADPSLVAFMREDSNIYLRDLDGGSDVLVGPGWYPAWSPDGMNLVYAGFNGGNLDVMVRQVEPVIGAPRFVTTETSMDWSPAWSPNAMQIAFVSDRDGTSNIYVVDTDTMGSAFGTPTLVVTDGDRPTWSPDGSKLAFSRQVAVGDHDIWVVDLETGEETQITSGLDDDKEPAWEPYVY